MSEDGVKDTASTVVNSFIKSFPHHQVSEVHWHKEQKSPSCATKMEAGNVQTDKPFDFFYGSWFVCSEYPLHLTFKEHNELLGWYAKIPSSNWRGRFIQWTAKVLNTTNATCIGIMDPDDCELTVFFWPVELEVIKSHVEPIMSATGLRMPNFTS
ncbi:MAG: hypothetical protein ACYSWP_04595 [Planctomycetota bacterium]